jgi:hypothetical protein
MTKVKRLNVKQTSESTLIYLSVTCGANRISAKHLERRGEIPACSSLCYIRGTWLHTKATVTLNFCVLEGPAAQLDQLRHCLNGYISHR